MRLATYIVEAAVLVTDIQSQCAKNENLQYSFVMHSLDFLLNSFENKDNVSAQKYHFLLFSISSEYRELESFGKDSILQLKERMGHSSLAEETKESFLSQTIRMFISDFLENEDLTYQVVAFKVDHYFTFVLFKIPEEEREETTEGVKISLFFLSTFIFEYFLVFGIFLFLTYLRKLIAVVFIFVILLWKMGVALNKHFFTN